MRQTESFIVVALALVIKRRKEKKKIIVGFGRHFFCLAIRTNISRIFFFWCNIKDFWCKCI